MTPPPPSFSRATPAGTRSWGSRLAGLGLSALLAAGLVPASVGGATAAHAADDDCDPVAVLAFRGSGEKNLDSSVTTNAGQDHRYGTTHLVTNGWEGPMLQRMFAAFAEVRLDGSFRADEVPVLSIGPADDTTDLGYPAIAAGWEAFSRLNGSAAKGVAAAESTISAFKREQLAAGCAAPTFIATGYSQGAMVARLLAQQNTVDVVAAVNIGDPFQKGGAPGNVGSGKDGNGFMRWNYPWYQDRWDAFYDLPLHKSALCHKNDLICDFRWGTFWRLTATEHTNYMDADHPDEATDKANELAALAYRITQEAASTTPTTGTPADVVFAIDTTGSMWPYIDQAVATAQAAAEATLRTTSGSRVGLVEYRDHGDEFVSRVVVPLTTDYDELTTGLRGLMAIGGGDWPEAVYSGIVTAARMDFRPSAARSIVVLGDAPAHDPEPVTGYTASSVAALLGTTPFTGAAVERGARIETAAFSAEARPVATATTPAEDGTLPIVLYSLAADRSLADQLAPVVDATGGLSFELDDAAGVSAALEAALEDTLDAPIAYLGTSPAATVGIETVVSAVGSVSGDPDLTFEFDLDGDGTYETPSADGVATVTFTTAGTHAVGVRVADSRGRASVATADVDVAPVEALEPLTDPDNANFTLRAPETVRAGDVLALDVAETDLDGAAFLLVAGDDPWGAAPAVEYDPAPDGWSTDGITVPADLPGGTYQAVLGLPDGRFGVTSVQVLDAEQVIPSPDHTGQPPADAGPEPTVPATPVANSDPVTPPAAGAVPSSSGALARTGLDSGTWTVLAGIAVLLLALGTTLKVTARRRHG